MTDIRSSLAEGAARLKAAGIENPWREARLLLAHATGFSQAQLIGYPEHAVGDCGDYMRLVARRARREPVSHLIGRREFWSLEFEVTPATLDPRPDSETVVEAALAEVADRGGPLQIADLGSGTGCLLAALLSELPAASGVAIDRSVAAATVARRNFGRLGLAGRARVVVGDWGLALAGGFDLIVANPPYIPSGAIASLMPEVARFDPESALDGGCDGLDAVRRLMTDLPRLLKPSGAAVVEFGEGQADAVARIAAGYGFGEIDIRDDLGSRPRCAVCRLTES